MPYPKDWLRQPRWPPPSSKEDKMMKPLRVLLVEDSEDDALFVIRALRGGGFSLSFERVQTEAEMVCALEREAWDLIISDYVMPGFGGLQALEVVKKRQLDLPFILISG